MEESPYLLRPIREAEFPDFWGVLEAAFATVEPLGERDVIRTVTEFDRTLAAFDGEKMVGTAAVATFLMTVPGGRRPLAGVTLVGVHPAWRRRGVLRALMHRQLRDLHESGEPVAALYASEAGIYGRYGYGCATRVADFTIKRGEGAFVAGAPTDPGLRLRLTTPDKVRSQLAAVFTAQAGDRPGSIDRPGPAWWDHALNDPEHRREGFTPRQCVIAEDDGGARGYALIATRTRWNDDHLPDGALNVKELCATDPAAYAALWRHVLDRDLIETVTAPARPPDDPVQHLLADPRRLRTTLADGLWLRLVTLDRALAQRSYAAAVDVVIEVDDPVCPWNTGRWHLAGDAGGATCEPTARAADVTLPVAVLAAAYLGAGGLGGAARAGLVGERRAGAVAALSRALAWDPQPWCPMEF
jgi:predicted acetyltransferase